MIFKEALSLLCSSHSSKRRRAAKVLRHLGKRQAGPFLLAALKEEVKDRRTWETQYQMIMALGESGYSDCLPVLRELSTRTYESTAIPLALGDAIVRLSGRDNGMRAILDLLNSNNLNLIEGAFRAMAMLRMHATPAAIATVLDFVEALNPAEVPNNALWFWVAVAAAGWETRRSQSFLEKCASSHNEGLSKAAVAARSGRYVECAIL